MPVYALREGAKLVIINMGPTEMDGLAHIRIDAKAGEVTPLILKRVKDQLGLD